MSCESVLEQISSHLDGMLTSEERENMAAHMGACRSCNAQYHSMKNLRAGLRELEKPSMPASLSFELRVLASHERERQLARASFSARINYWAGRLKLQFDNLMRPVALPVAGGVVSALLAFCALVPSLIFVHTPSNEPPLSISIDPDGKIVDWTGELPRLESINADTSGDEIVVELTIDDQGHVVDYLVRQGQLTPVIQNIIMFSKFTPAMFFYQPAWGKKLVTVPRRRDARG
ncbi:MAG: hypothetical protein C5B51_16515 [Terriglobia bacterium]|nr:MAG: hypothetical protein C5B51_16515 [Terriglobia bacterium]